MYKWNKSSLHLQIINLKIVRTNEEWTKTLSLPIYRKKQTDDQTNYSATV